MKRILIILALAIHAQPLSAQVEWAPIGAQWYFTEPYTTDYLEINYILIESTGDTIINGQVCKVLKLSRNGHELISYEHIAQLGDTILYYNPNTDGFHTLYNFAAQVGDTVHVHTLPFKPTDAFLLPYYMLQDGVIPYFSYRIVGIDSTEVSGVWLKRQEVDFLMNDDRWGFSNITGGVFLMEGIGSLTYFFGRGNWIGLDESVTLLRCYKDGALDFKNQQWESSCTLTSTVKPLPQVQPKVFPNPANDKLFVELGNDSGFILLNVVDGFGRLRMTHSFAKPTQLDIAHLEAGIYIVKIYGNARLSTHKILKR